MNRASPAPVLRLAGFALLALLGCERRPPIATGEILTTRTLGLAYLEENRLGEAESAFKRLTELAPREPLGFANLGLVYLRQGNYADAERSMRRALDLEPSDPAIRLMLAKVLALTDRVPEARHVLERTLADTPAHLKSLYALAQLPADGADPEERARRVEYLQRLVALTPANLTARLLLIKALLEHDKPDEALAHLEQLHAQVAELPPQAVPFFDQAVEQMRAGRASAALRPMLVLTNFLRATGAYQAGVSALEGPGGILIGFPIVTLSRAVTERHSQADVLASLRFSDVTTVARLDAVRLGGSGGAHVAAGDYDGDGDVDLYATAARRGVLLRNDGGVFTDVTQQAGLRASGGGAAIFSDYDNDGHLDLLVARQGGDALLRNRGDGTFLDVTGSAGIHDQQPSHAPLFLDTDHDGDLDLLLPGPGPNRLYRNNGDGSFLESAQRMGIAGQTGHHAAAAFGDFDGDAGLDLIVAHAEAGVEVYRNTLDGRFANVTASSGVAPGTGIVALAVGDYNNDGSLDLFLAGPGAGESSSFTNKGDGSFERDRRPASMFSAVRGLSVRQAEFLDFDNDGWLDLLVAGEAHGGGRSVLLFRNGAPGRFDDVSSLLPREPGSARRVAVLDYDEDGDLDLVVGQADGTLRLLRNDGGNANHYLKLQLTGLMVAGSKNNHFGIGASVEVRAGGMYQIRVVTQPVTYFGLGQQRQADALRIVWTNGVPQNVFYPVADQGLVEEQILKGSCPFLYAWNGERYEFVTDVMWRSALGMPLDIMGGGGRGYAPAAASREYIRIPGDALKPKDGVYSVQVTGELWETGYLDEVKLVVVDHPDSVRLLVDERFVPPGDAALRIYQVAHPRAPVAAADEQGRDLRPLLLERDDRYVSQFRLGRFQGLTEAHDLVLDLGELDPRHDVTLFLNGWILPTDASINVALSQSKQRVSLPPQVQVVGPDGQWHTVIDNMGFPSGKAKTVVVDLAGKFLSRDRRVRIRTNMQIYWDQVFFATGAVGGPAPQAILEPTAADLRYRGFSRMYRKGGRYGPFWFDYGDVTKAPRWLRLKGQFTRFGNVVDLLERADDRYVVFGPGDAITVEFDARAAPPLPAGWRRDFLLYSDSWLKDADLNTATGQTVEPLPFHGMSKYPYGADESFPTDAEHQRYLRRYNTRRMPDHREGIR
jgi:cytochrome c-type biogenesis protein CcmH/NrfG